MAIPTGAVVAWLTEAPMIGVDAAFGCLLGIIVSPDLDIDHRTVSENVLPGILGWLWFIYWWPYAKLHKHRGSSHWPLIGTMVRVVYGFWWLVLLDIELLKLWPLLIGLIVSDMTHLLMDL